LGNVAGIQGEERGGRPVANLMAGSHGEILKVRRTGGRFAGHTKRGRELGLRACIGVAGKEKRDVWEGGGGFTRAGKKNKGGNEKGRDKETFGINYPSGHKAMREAAV